MRILSYEVCGDCVTGILETEDAYVAFSVSSDDRLELEQRYPKERYRDLSHFQGVMGKFEPYVFFLREPVEIGVPTFQAVKMLFSTDS